MNKALAWAGWGIAGAIGIGFVIYRLRSSSSKAALPVRTPQPNDTPIKPPPGTLPDGYVWIYGDPNKIYHAGFHRPFFVTESMIRSGLEDQHATLIGISPRSQPPRFDPRMDPLYSDKWDEWLSANYSGQQGWFAAKRQWDWLTMAPKSNA